MPADWYHTASVTSDARPISRPLMKVAFGGGHAWSWVLGGTSPRDNVWCSDSGLNDQVTSLLGIRTEADWKYGDNVGGGLDSA